MSQDSQKKQGICPIPGCGHIFRNNHLGIDAHVVHAHSREFGHLPEVERYKYFCQKFPRPWSYRDGEDAKASSIVASSKMCDDTDFTHSTYREKLLEHLFVSEILQEAWVKRRQVIEVLRSEIDASGYDIVLVCGSVMRHVQLKSSRLGASTASQKVNVALSEKPAGCVVWMQFEENQATGRITLGYRFFGGGPHEALPELGGYKVARHTKANATGVKLERPRIREVPGREFSWIHGGIEELIGRLFGD